MELIPPHLNDRIQTPVNVLVTSHASKSQNSKVVTAPAVYGRSFSLRWSYGPRFSVGQMLVLIDKEHYGAPLEVLDTFFPIEKFKATGRRKDRVYMGDRKLGKRFVAGVIEIKITPGEPLVFRMLYPSGQQIHDWKPLDLAKLRLRTSEEQRAHITAFTGIIYKALENRPERSFRVGKRKPDTFNTVMDAEFAKELQQLAEKKPRRKA